METTKLPQAVKVIQFTSHFWRILPLLMGQNMTIYACKSKTCGVEWKTSYSPSICCWPWGWLELFCFSVQRAVALEWAVVGTMLCQAVVQPLQCPRRHGSWRLRSSSHRSHSRSLPHKTHPMGLSWTVWALPLQQKKAVYLT